MYVESGLYLSPSFNKIADFSFCDFSVFRWEKGRNADFYSYAHLEAFLIILGISISNFERLITGAFLILN